MNKKIESNRVDKKICRCIEILRKIPAKPHKISTSQLYDHLERMGFNVSKRTVQRDLKELQSCLNGLEVDEHKDLPGWSWDQKVSSIMIPAMDPEVAIAFRMIEKFFYNMLPSEIVKKLSRYFNAAKKALSSHENSNFIDWEKKIRFLPRSMPLLPAKTQSDVVEKIYNALFHQKKIRGLYKRRDQVEAEYVFNPLGMVLRDSVMYLVATVWQYEDPRHYAIHRFLKVEILEDDVSVPDGFDLDDYLEQGSFWYGSANRKIFIELAFEQFTGSHLLETPLSQDQEVIEQPGKLIIKATVNDSQQLRWWILGFGEKVEVLQPDTLREEIKEILTKATLNYDT